LPIGSSRGVPEAGAPAIVPVSGDVKPQARDDDGPAPAAPATQPKASGSLGRTVASLGDPARPGAWLETPLVRNDQPGEVHYQGKGVSVTLIPADAPVGAGSRLSVAAMQALGAPLGDLIEVEVIAGG